MEACIQHALTSGQSTVMLNTASHLRTAGASLAAPPHGVLRAVVVLVLSFGCSRPALLPSPRLHLDEPSRDLGDIAVSEQQVDVVFRLENRGTSPLNLLQVASAGCLCLDARALEPVIEPDGSASVLLQVRPSRPGPKSARAIVTTDDPARPLVELSVSWNAVDACEWAPSELDFGRVRPGAGRTQTVHLIRRADLHSHAAHLDDPRAEHLQTHVLAGDATLSIVDAPAMDGDSASFDVVLTTGAEMGPGHGRVRFPNTQDPARFHSLPVRWRLPTSCAPSRPACSLEPPPPAPLWNARS